MKKCSSTYFDKFFVDQRGVDFLRFDRSLDFQTEPLKIKRAYAYMQEKVDDIGLSGL
jgi:hypothetical protein